MLRALLAHPQEVLHIRNLVYCVRVMPVGCTRIGAEPQALTAYPGDLNHCRNCAPAPEDGLKERPKHVRQK
jgi:hypothetical protein